MMGSIPDEALVWVKLAIIASLAICAALLVGRAFGSSQDPARRPAWIASLFGLIGMLTLGVLFPLRWVDVVLGGSNFWNLAQALCATIAFWFFYQATRLGTGQPRRERPWWIALCAVLMARRCSSRSSRTAARRRRRSSAITSRTPRATRTSCSTS